MISNVSTDFRAFRIHNDPTGYRAGIEPMHTDDLTPGEVLVKVAYSSVNYKDALAGTGKDQDPALAQASASGIPT